MFIILHGEDTFRSRQKLNELQKLYLEKSDGFNFEKLDGAQINFQTLRNALEAQSLFMQKRFVVVENILENNELKQSLANYNFNTTTIGLPGNPIVVVFYERDSVAKDKDYKNILKYADKVQEFQKLSPREALVYFSKTFNTINKNIISKVLERCQPAGRSGGQDMWQTHNELKKLYIYKIGSEVEEEDLDILQIGTLQAQIFPTIDAIFAGDRDKAFYNLLIHWQTGEHPQILFNMIEMQLKNIILVKEALQPFEKPPSLLRQLADSAGRQGKQGEPQERSIAVKLGLHPYVVKKTLALVDKFSWEKLKTLYARVESLDVKNKTGQVSTYLSAELLAAAVASSV
ncbi:MAG: hypothetical protein A3F94_02985 [Candidatus Spechtbacteria bacterium RIFCSPLOWO2_12_FULL_38_22]|uniref:DNA polymerase III subunit delta n=1 Tax=Candidatus Spechtbacteria bacterium RIFCSPLOWO2_12_FULL_38_22 TaxID=1802165 RepID=A0A1G2HJ54_9BACT|nr:MAG: hypothetical protein A2728_02770 [Candidatus Spechtbacteria bacterium RIFCSPHIGHO2_01_FULL_38_11]OGZ59619.1 MAG: hypothetical protein A3A00_00260 [Candidatus Spechtbacteria bacterium RIFCSPLOWO2_01_FULL_38_20]OGZ60038.1 MAG: hypothetical protein A3E58_01680 [Candidatus Spechtbacteria bacterium RIFCSPHIGHO2_12_FULL_38_30]OGZ62261.1 MAG: hypothetical protein A3F94_02985 [Candidatus Spechtbacteria bacterium RIFCSPLOWO2_12_FULL_38_22]